MPTDNDFEIQAIRSILCFCVGARKEIFICAQTCVFWQMRPANTQHQHTSTILIRGYSCCLVISFRDTLEIMVTY